MDKNNKNLEVLFNAFIGLIVIISSILTFGFFYEFLPNFLPVELVGEDISKIFSGLLGTVILDLGSLMWLYTNLKLAENDTQRTVTLFASIIDFVGSLITSFTFLVITGQKLYNMPENMRSSIGLVSLISIAGILVYNFLSIWLYKRNSEESLKDIYEGKRKQLLQTITVKRREALDKDVNKMVIDKFNVYKPELADTVAKRLVEVMLEEELSRISLGTNGKFSSVGESAELNVPKE